MQNNMFQQPISHDFVPLGSHCEWCEKEAVEHLTALGGRHHNQSGRFCASCARAFIQQVRNDVASPVALGRNTIQELASFYPLASEQRLASDLPDGEILVASKQSLWLCRLN